MILGDASRAHRLLHEKGLTLCMLSIACPNFLIDEAFLPQIPFGSDLDPNSDNVFFFFLFKGERIQISLKAGHHRPASETPLNGVSLA